MCIYYLREHTFFIREFLLENHNFCDIRFYLIHIARDRNNKIFLQLNVCHRYHILPVSIMLPRNVVRNIKSNFLREF